MDIFRDSNFITLTPEQKEDLHRRGLLFEDFFKQHVSEDPEAHVVKADAIMAFVQWRQQQREVVMKIYEMDAARSDIDTVFPREAFRESFAVPVPGGDDLFDDVYEGYRLDYDISPDMKALPRFVPAALEDCMPIEGARDEEVNDKLDALEEMFKKLNNKLDRILDMLSS